MKRLLAVFAVLAGAACDHPLIPDATAGFYRLESINGQHVPAALNIPFTLQNFVERGDFLLQPDGRFEIVITAQYPADITGTGHASGGSITLSWQYDGDTTHFSAEGTIGGDSITLALPDLQGTETWVFRRFARRPPGIPDGQFTLATVNGLAVPAPYSQDSFNGSVFVRRVMYDSLALRDGLFYTRSRAERWAQYTPNGDSAVSSTEYRLAGTFTSTAARLALTSSLMNGGPLASDTFQVTDTTLVASPVSPSPYTAVYHRRH